MNSHVSMEDSKPFYFGTVEQQLFGNYHSPVAASQQQKSAVVLCYPLGDEYIRAHRAYRQLAIRLARAGFPVLRFDYFGSGDSAGDDVDVRIERWLGDIATAIAEVQQRSGLRPVYLMGLRLGATLATLAAVRRKDVAGLVLWEPVVSGSRFMEEITEWHEQKLRYFLRHPEEKTYSAVEVTERLGFVFSNLLLDDIHGLDLTSFSQKPADHILITEQNQQELITQFAAHLTRLGSQIDHQQLEEVVIWREDVDKALIPNQSLQAIVSWILQREGA